MGASWGGGVQTGWSLCRSVRSRGPAGGTPSQVGSRKERDAPAKHSRTGVSAAVLAGLQPAWRFARMRPAAALREA
jgi:hypothetical protein